MKIQNDGIASAATSIPAPVESGSSEKSGSSFSSSLISGGGDQVDISSLSGNITASSNALAGKESARVSQLAALYAKGDYQVDSMQLSQKMVAGALSARGGGVSGNIGGNIAGGSFGGDN